MATSPYKGAKKNHRNKLNTQQYYIEYTREKHLWILKALRYLSVDVNREYAQSKYGYLFWVLGHRFTAVRVQMPWLARNQAAHSLV
jgi:hypothetical protein